MRRLEGVNEFYIAKEIFQRLGLEFPPDTDPSRQIAAVDLLARGKWDRIRKGDFTLTPKDKILGLAIGLKRWLRDRASADRILEPQESIDEDIHAGDALSTAA